MYRRILSELLYPPLWIIILLIPLCAAALIFIFVGGYEEHPLAYAAYVISFYTLSVTVLRCIRYFPARCRAIKKGVYDHPLGNRLMTDIPFRTRTGLYVSFAVNILYAAFNVISGAIYGSAWFYILALYYTILAVMRFLLVRFTSKVGIGVDIMRELTRSRLCGWILLGINPALSGAVLMILYQNKGYEYHGVLIYVMAAYTFYITILAVVNLVKYRKLGSPVMSMAKIISMSAALVSMLALETAMFSQFGGEMSEDSQRLMIALTGGGVSAAITAMAVYSIAKNTRHIREIRKENTDVK